MDTNLKLSRLSDQRDRFFPMLRLNTNPYKFEEIYQEFGISKHLSVQYDCLHIAMKDITEKIASVKKIII